MKKLKNKLHAYQSSCCFDRLKGRMKLHVVVCTDNWQGFRRRRMHLVPKQINEFAG